MGAVTVSIFSADSYWAASAFPLSAAPLAAADFLHSVQGLHLSFALLSVAIAGGLYIVPLYSALQERSLPETRARSIAANNIVNAGFMVLSAAACTLLLSLGWNVAELLTDLGRC